MSTLTGWPFWAPSDMAVVERALDLAALQAGEHLVDLGCGDGQVLVAAARRGSTVAGVECDPELVALAREALRANDLTGLVVEGDVFDFPLEGAHVIFTYLAPATLQRLRPRLQVAIGARLVTVDFEVPGLEPDEVDGRSHLYRLPAAPLAGADPGWQSAGVFVAVTPDRHSLTCLSLGHPGGAVTVELSPELQGHVVVATGADDVAPGEEVAVDLRWEETDVGMFLAGAVTCAGVPDLPVYAFVTEDDEGLWEVTHEGVARVRRHLARGWRPTTFAELLAACDED